MKKYIFRALSCAVLLATAVNGFSTNGIIEVKNYKICPEDQLELSLNKRTLKVTRDTTIYDTLQVADPTADSIYVYVVNVYPSFLDIQERRMAEGESFVWNDLTIDKAGTYDKTYKALTSGCDSIYRLLVTTYHVDTIDTVATLCPYQSITWHGMTYSQTGKYAFPGIRPNGDRVYYRLDLKVKTMAYVDTLFRICEGEQVVFDGVSYGKAGEYYHPYTCDTTYRITIAKNPSTLHMQNGLLDGTHPYYWRYTANGEVMVDTLSTPGTYEHTTRNETTGCNDIWRLVLSKDETKYHFIEEETICENEPFSWRGREGLNRLGIGQTIHYFDNYRTKTGQDSIYELILTVKPVLRSSRTIPFCGSIEWKGTRYSESAILFDTLTSIQYSCDSIVKTILQKGISFHHHDTTTITPGEMIIWRGQTITTDGQYDERHLTALGCDSIYSLGVGLREAAKVTNTKTDVASICEGNYYEWRGNKYFNSNIYVDSVFVNGDRAQGLDSLYILKLTVHPVYSATERIAFTAFPATYREFEFTTPGSYHEFHYLSSTGCDSVITVYADLEVIRNEETVTVCPSELPYRWRDHEFYESYRYVETEKDKNGNDSVQYILNLNVQNIPESRVTKTICRGGSYTFGDKVLTETGVYKHTFKDSGCDSVVILSLNVLSADTNIFVHHMDDGQSYTWNGTTYRETGTYYDYRTNRFGCDSINILQLTVNHVDTVDTTVVLCPNEIPFFWHGIRAAQTNDYTITERQQTGDYIYYRLHLTVKEMQYRDTTFTICGNEQKEFNGVTYTQSGLFYNHLSCDTIIRVRINRLPQQVHVTNASLGGNHGYTWTYWENGVKKTDTFTEAGTYEYENTNAETGCSELWRLILTKDETEYHFVETLTKCEGEPFSWHGLNNLTNQGIGTTSSYLVNYQTRTGHDSIYELLLTVNPIERTRQVIPFCESYTLNGKLYTESTTVTDTAYTGLGCYSITEYVLEKGASFSRHDTATIVPGETLYWHGQIITNTGLYTDSYTSILGCDSIYTLGVGMKEAAEQMQMRTWNESICEGDTLEWRNKKYYNTGTYVDTVFVGNTREVDSLYVLNLAVHPTYLIRERITFHTFPGTYRGHEFTAHGETDTIRYTTVNGCDSIYIVTAEHELTRTEENVTICTGDTYIWSWNGTTYSESGRYVVTVKDAAGNDSVEHILNLNVRYIPETFVTQTICQGGSYTFGDRLLTESGEYEYTFKSGTCDSLVHLSLNVVHADTNKLVHHMNPGDHFTWNNEVYRETGTYFYYGTNRFGCDSVAVLELTVNHVDTIDTTVVACQRELPIRWHGINASQSGEYSGIEQQASGSYNFYRLHLTVRPIVQIDTTFTICDDEQVIFNNKTYSESGRFFDYLSCDTIIEVNIYKHPQRIYETRAALGQDKYTWTYGPAGQQTTVEYSTPGTYEFEFPNAETGCSEIWRLILSQDMNEYHFTERLEICEGDEFSWHGMGNLSHQYIGEEHEYKAEYKTRNGKDSIYTLYLTVKPVQRTYRTITFCGETTYKGVTYTSNTIVRDTMIGANGCDSIILINFNKANSYFFSETKDLPQGKVFNWHGMDIYTDGVYRDEYQTQYGCDSIYELRVTIIPATPETNQYSEQWSICAGDTVLWRGKDLWRGGTYVDTVWTAGKEKVDSIFTLNLNVWPSYKDTIVRHLYNCNDGSAIQYNGKLYYDDDTIVTVFPTIHGCDSIEKVFMHFNTALFLSDTAKIADNKLPYEWRPNNDTTILVSATGTYQYTKPVPGGCNNTWELHLIVYPTFFYKDSVVLCENDLPYYWDKGPAEHAGDALSAAAGQTKLITYTYSSVVTGADSIYQLKMTVKERQYSIQQLYICNGDQETLSNGKTYNSNTMVPDSIYRDTVVIPSPTEGCDSIVYYEILVRPVQTSIKTEIMHLGDTIFWMGDTITKHETHTYTKDSTDEVTGCKITNQLRVIAEHRDVATICALDTPYIWSHNNGKYFVTGLYTDTVRDAENFITEFHALNLEVKIPVDTTIYLRGCLPAGVTFNDKTYLKSGIYRDAIICDTMYTIHVKVDTIHEINLADTICEEFLPYILGRQDPDTIWAEGIYHHTDTTACGCDSIVNLNLRIIPKLTKNDSTFVCEDRIMEKPVVLGDTVTPWFDFRNGGLFHGTWEGKWHGVSYTTDTIVWNCDSSYYHHIIVRPRQVQPAVDTFYLCKGDSVQLLWPYSDKWFKEPGLYKDTLKTNSAFMDEKHGYVHNDRDYLCDSIIHWLVIYADTVHEERTAHIAMGDSLFFDNQWRYAAGDYDSIAQAVDTNSYGEHCKYVMTLHLYVDSTYHFRDTMEVCEFPGKEIHYIWSDGHERIYTMPKKDTALHVIDTLPTLLYRFDSIYDMYIDYRQKYFTQIYDTICEGDSVRFDIHHRNNTITQRFLSVDGVYYDTIPALNGCDSIIELYLKTRDSIPTTYISHMITDREIPYLWVHQWKEGGLPKDSTDTLRATGIYQFTMPSQYGCDSTIVLNFTVHQTHVFRDTIELCEWSNTTHTHVWSTGYQQKYTLPQDDDTLHYYDTLQTRILFDSIYDLYVRFHAHAITYIDTSLCHNQSIRFGLTKDNTYRVISKTGEYRDTLTRVANGCDSIIVLRLNVYPLYSHTYNHHISSVDTPYVWEHIDATGKIFPSDTLYAEGKYDYTFTNQHGCDSTDVLNLYVHQSYLYRDTVQICASETPYTWGDKKDIYTTGEYIQYFRTHDNMADSTHVRFVRVMPVKHDTIQAMICEGDSMRFGLTKSNLPRFIHMPGLYNDTLTTVHGCDSIITLTLNVFPRHFGDTTVHIADVDTPYVWKHVDAAGHIYNSDKLYAAGRYGFRFPSQYGCDSIDSLTLVVHPTYLFNDTISICSSETPYNWYNVDANGDSTLFRKAIYETGQYIKHLQTHDGYDSTYMRYIYVLPVKRTEIHDSICAGENNFYVFNGRKLTESGVFTDTLTAANGCDSIVKLNLTVNKPYYSFREEHIVEGQSVTAYGKTFTTDTVYTIKGLTPNGCDSTTVLKVVVHPMVDTIVTVCKSELPYIWINKWNGQITPLYTAGLYRNDTTFINGERMYYGLKLIVNNQVFDTIRHAMCEGSSYEFKGNTITKQGVYRDTLSAANGCDSIVTLILTVNKPFYNVIRETILEGHSYEFYGETCTTSGNYTHYSRTPEGCDSTTILQLTVHPIVDTIITVCDADLPVIWHNRWNGNEEKFFSNGIYRNDTTINGEKRFYGIQVNVNNQVFDTIRAAICEGSSYQFAGDAKTTAGIYRDTLRAANGCDSIETLILTVNKPYYHYYVEHILEGQQVPFFDTLCTTTGTYTHYGRTPEGCDSTTVLQLVVHPMVDTVVTVCKTDLPYLWVNKWNGQITPLYTAGTYRNDTTYVNGERMFYGLQLLVTEPTDTTIYREICEGDLYNFNNRYLNTAGEYRDTIKNHNGCDSIVILHLNVLKKYYNSINRSIYEGDTVMFQGIPYSTAGIYPVRLSSSYGCDSIIELRLTVIRLFDDSVTVCANELPYRWTLPSDSTKQKTIYESGIYRDTVVNSEGVQSVIGLKVKVLPIAHAPEPIIARICEGDFYKFGASLLTEQGTYYDTLTAVNGCDSVVMLSLQVQPRVHQVDTRTIFEGDTVMFYDSICTTSGIYTHTVQNGKCPETHQLILRVLKEFHVDTTAYTCKNQLPFVWHGIEYNETGDYSLPTAWTDSSRVVTTLHLFVRDAFYGEKNISLCEGNMFIFRRDTFRTSAIFYDTIPSQHGCDSIIKYTLQVHPKYERWDTVHISDKDFYEFNGRQLTIPGDYEYTGKTSNDCDSSIFLHLEVHPSYLYTEFRDICAPDTVHWHGQVIHMDTAYKVSNTTTRYGIDTTYTYRDPYLTRYGFDSIYELRLAVHPSYYIYEQHLIKEGETTIIHGINVTETNKIYSDTLKTMYGCDSVYQIAVNTKRMMEIERKVTICDGEYYDLYGQKLTKKGNYTKMSPDGDTIMHIDLTVNPVSVEQKRIVITDEEVPYSYGGRLYYPELPVWVPASQSWDKDVKTTQYTNEFFNQYGCDSTLYLDFVVTTHYSDWNQIPLCSNETLIIDNDTITHAGYYTFVRRSTVTKRMDSLYRVEIYDAPKYEMPPIKRTICEGDTVHFYNRILAVEGDYQQKLKSVDGCDSIITMRLTVTPTIHKETSVRVYEKYLPYIWKEVVDGKVVERECYLSGDYVHSWQTGECINTSTLHLTMVQPVTEERIVCGDDSIKWRNDKWYSKEGFYYDTIRRPNTDTITDVYVLHLIKGQPTDINSVRVAEVEEEANMLDIYFSTDNGLYSMTKVNVLFKNGPSSAFTNLYNATTSKQGDEYVVSVPIPQYADTCYEGHHKYVKPGYYSVQVQLDNGACGRSESQTVEFLMRYPSWIIQQNWMDIVAPLNSDCNCGYEFSKVRWTDENDYPYVSQAAGYLHNNNLRVGNNVVMWATRKGESTEYPTYPLTIVQYTWQKYDDPIIVYPTQAPRHAPMVTIEAPQDGTYEIYSSTGMLIGSGIMSEGKTTLTLPATSGVYFIRTKRNNQAESHKVLIY